MLQGSGSQSVLKVIRLMQVGGKGLLNRADPGGGGLVLKGPEKQHPDRKKADSEGGGPRGQALKEEVTPCPMGMSGPNIGSGQGVLVKGCRRDMGKSSLRSLDMRWEEEESQDGKARGWGAV